MIKDTKLSMLEGPDLLYVYGELLALCKSSDLNPDTFLALMLKMQCERNIALLKITPGPEDTLRMVQSLIDKPT